MTLMTPQPSHARDSSFLSGGDIASDQLQNSPPKHALRDRDHRAAPYLPFRRISLAGSFPTPSSSQRVSVASAGSIESLPEEEPYHRMTNSDMSNPASRSSSRFSERSERQGRPPSTSSFSSIDLSARNRKSDLLNRTGGQKDKNKSRLKHSHNDNHDEKREKIMREIMETETAYVEGLDLIYSHFLSPLIQSLSEPVPLLTRNELTTIFSNFVDIWNLHRSLYAHLEVIFSPPEARTNTASPHVHPNSLERKLSTTPMSTRATRALPKIRELSRILLSHFPYLSMYNPFVTAFPSSVSLLTALSTPPPHNHLSSFPRAAPSGSGLKVYDPNFALWLKEKEADPICRRLKLRDWMLTIIQRCPRYLLLVKDLISCSRSSSPEHTALLEVHGLLAKITSTLNSALHAHSLVLSLISLQRATPNLPFPLIAPGRVLLRRSTLVKVDRGSDRRIREVLLFSDCLIWLSRGGDHEEWAVWGEWATSSMGLEGVASRSILAVQGKAINLPARPKRPWESGTPGLGRGSPPSSSGVVRKTGRIRSRSDAGIRPKPSRPSPSSPNMLPSPNVSLIREAAKEDGSDERWWYRGRADLLDLEVVMSPAIAAPGEECMFEVLSPEGSFALYTASQEERDDWVTGIRNAKAARLSSFQITHPDSTLSSSDSNNHIRKALQALPHDPSTTPSTPAAESPSGDHVSLHAQTERRAKVEHFVPAIWVPDQKTEACMRCKSRFGWRRRRHHCRLCGRVVCASCSEKTFYIADMANADKPSVPARACNACYETVFPVLPLQRGQGSASMEVGSNNDMRASVSMPSLALAVPPFTTPVLPSSTTFGGLFHVPSYFRSSQGLLRPPSLSHTQSAASTASASDLGLAVEDDTLSVASSDVAFSVDGPTKRSIIGEPTSADDSSDSALITELVRSASSKTYIDDGGDARSDVSCAFPDSSHAEGSRISRPNEEETIKVRAEQAEVLTSLFDPSTIRRRTVSMTITPPHRIRWSMGDSPPSPVRDLGSLSQEDGSVENGFRSELSAPETVEATHGSMNAVDRPRAIRRVNNKRISIAPFPTQVPLSSVHDTPVTAKTRVQGHGRSRRYSLMLGGTIRGPPVGTLEEGGVESADIPRAKDSTRFGYGLAIGRLEDILGLNREPASY